MVSLPLTFELMNSLWNSLSYDFSLRNVTLGNMGEFFPLMGRYSILFFMIAPHLKDYHGMNRFGFTVIQVSPVKPIKVGCLGNNFTFCAKTKCFFNSLQKLDLKSNLFAERSIRTREFTG